MTTRSLKVYDSLGALAETINMNTAFGSILYDRVDRQEVLIQARESNLMYVKSIYRPEFIFIINNADKSVWRRLLMYEMTNHSFVLQVNGFSYSVVLGAQSKQHYHPAGEEVILTMVLRSISTNAAPGMDELVQYDMIYNMQYPVGIEYGDDISVKFINSDLSAVGFYYDGTNDLLLKHYNQGNLVNTITCNPENTYYLTGYSGRNSITLTGNTSGSYTNITDLMIWGL